MSKKSVKKINEAMKSWNLYSKLQWGINQIAEEINPQVRGWHNYYTKFGKSAFWYVMKHLNDKLARWARRKYKDFKKHPKHAKVWLESLSRRERGMFVHWSLGYVPQAAK
jgi:RNA-directed DNA polymerase